MLNAACELQLHVQAAQKRRKQRNDGVQAWHGRLRQRATRAEKLRFQALKADDQEAYMKMVEESKNERLTMLFGKTNDFLVRLGAARMQLMTGLNPWKVLMLAYMRNLHSK